MFKKIKESLLVNKMEKQYPELNQYIANTRNNKVSMDEMIKGINKMVIVANKSSKTTQEAINNFKSLSKSMSKAGYSAGELNINKEK